MSIPSTQILNDKQISRMIKRLAFQVYESNFDEKELIVAGVSGKGDAVAALLARELGEISKIKVHVTSVLLNKDQLNREQVKLGIPIPLTNKSVLVVDDVLNTGRTFVYALLPFVGMGIKKIQTLVLVDRNHRLYPISADFIGMSLSTTLQEHVDVTIQKGKVNVYLR